MSDRFGLYTSSLGGASAVSLQQMDSLTINTNRQLSPLIPGGLLDVCQISMSSARPSVSVGTRDIYTALNGISILNGLALPNNSTFYIQKRLAQGAFDTTNAHIGVAMIKGFAQIASISASNDGDGSSAEIAVTALWNRLQDPLKINDGISLSGAPTPACVTRYWMGPVYHNSGKISGIQQFSVNPGITFDATPYDGDSWPERGYIMKREPTLTFTTVKTSVVATLNSLFNSAVTGNVDLYLQKANTSAGSTSTGRIDPTLGQHIKITAAAGDISPDTISVSEQDDATVNITVTVQGTLAVDLASTIPV